MSLADRDHEQRAILWLALGLVVASAFTLWPFAPWVVLAVWTGVSGRRVHRPLTRLLGGRPRTAGVITVAMLTFLLAPVVLVLTLLVADAIRLIDQLLTSDRAQDLLRQLVSDRDPKADTSSGLLELAMSQGGRAWEIVQQIAGTAAGVVIGLVVLVAGIYGVLIEGDRWYAWIEAHVPISAVALRRFADAFTETGRGLFVGIVGAGLAQATVATILYVALGVPQPFALGFLTLVFSVIPAVGTAIVWGPVAAGLALTDRPLAALVLTIAGVVVISTIDNLVRPWLSRRGKLQLPTYVVLVAMFGAIEVMGPWGVLIGPLIARLTKEALEIRRDHPLGHSDGPDGPK